MLTIVVIGTVLELARFDVPVGPPNEHLLFLNNCEYCNDVFIVHAPGQRFCSKPSCRQLWHRYFGKPATASR